MVTLRLRSGEIVILGTNQERILEDALEIWLGHETVSQEDRREALRLLGLLKS